MPSGPRGALLGFARSWPSERELGRFGLAAWAGARLRAWRAWGGASSWAASWVWPMGKLGLFHFFPILFLSFVLFYSFHHFKSNSLLNGCSTKSPIQQNKSMHRHECNTQAPRRFYFTKLAPRYKIK